MNPRDMKNIANDKELTMNIALNREFVDDLKSLDKEIQQAENELLKAEIQLRKLHLKRQALNKIIDSLRE